jgi:transposase
MDREGQYAAKSQMVAQMQAGQSWQAAATSTGVQTSRTAAYRLLQRVRSEGARALSDRRHGHPVKLREMVKWPNALRLARMEERRHGEANLQTAATVPCASACVAP